MSIFDALKIQETIEASKDTLGGAGTVVPTDVYPCTIELAYIDKARSDAMSLNLHLQTESGQQIRQTLWITSGKAKGCKPYYTDKNGKNHYLPGYNIANDICLLTINMELSATDPEEKVIKLYDFDARQEMPQKKMAVTELHGQKIRLAIEKQIVDKNVKQDDGTYRPGGETREQNEIVKAFHAEYQVTVTEAKAGLKAPDFLNLWLSKYKDVTRNKAEATKGGAKPGAPAAAATPRESLFAWG